MRDACRVINAPCSFGRVCESDASFCPRYVNQAIKQFIPSLSFICSAPAPGAGHGSPRSGEARPALESSGSLVTPLERNVHVTSGAKS